VVPIFGSKPWSPGNFGFRGFLVSGELSLGSFGSGTFSYLAMPHFCAADRPSNYFSKIFGTAWNREARRVFCLRGSNLRMRTMEPRILRYPGLTCMAYQMSPEPSVPGLFLPKPTASSDRGPPVSPSGPDLQADICCRSHN